MTRRPWLVLVLAAVLGSSCAGKSEEEEVSTDQCVPYCEELQAAGCNQLGNVASCKLACGLLLTDPSECGAASQALLDCRLAQPDICRGCAAQQDRVTAACTM